MGSFPFCLPVRNKCCATCAWWTGERQIIFGTSKPMSVRAVSNATCIAHPSPKSLHTAPTTCFRYQRWEKLG